MDFSWYPSENARWVLPGIHQTPVAPFPRPVLQMNAFWFFCGYADDIGFLACTPSVAAPRQGCCCARPTTTASYDSKRVGAGALPVVSRAAPMVGAPGQALAGPIPAPPAGLDDSGHFYSDGGEFGTSVLWIYG